MHIICIFNFIVPCGNYNYSIITVNSSSTYVVLFVLFIVFFCAAKLAAPQPVRLLKTEWCSVEIVAGHSHDFSVVNSCIGIPTYCFHTMLHWYGSDGTHAKLDIRRIIRKCVKDVRMNVCTQFLYSLAEFLLLNLQNVKFN